MSDAERMLASVGVMLDRLLLQEPGESGRPLRYNPLDYAILRRVETEPGCSGSELARKLNVARTSIQSAIDRLEKLHLVEKRLSSAGGRVRELHLTEGGVEMRRAIHKNDLANMELLLAPLSAQERARILPLVERIARHLT